MIKWCPSCRRDKDVSLFSKNRNKKDQLQSRCKDCSSKDSKSRYYEGTRKAQIRKRTKAQKELFRKYISELKSKTPCKDCENTFHSCQMDFDHLTEKKFNLSEAAKYGGSLENVKKEIDKCELVCANCHRLRTYKRSHRLLARTPAFHAGEEGSILSESTTKS